MDNPKISIVLPNYNGERYLERAINSFLQQCYLNKELIIVDAKSKDGSHDIIRGVLELNSGIKWIKEMDSGLSDAINIGINRCSGDMIGYMGNDDLLYQNILGEIAYHSELIEFDTIYFDSYTYYVKEKKCYLRKCPNLEINRINLLKYGTIVGLQNIFFKRHIFDKYKYNIQNKYSMDYELYLDFSEENYLHLYVPKVATVNIFDGNITGSLGLQQLLESKAVAIRHSRNLKERLLVYAGHYSIRNRRQMAVHIFKSFLKLLFNYKSFRTSVAGIVFEAFMRQIITKLKVKRDG